MDVKAKINGTGRVISLQGYEVREAATPLVPGENGGSLPTIDMQGQAIRDGHPAQRTAVLVDEEVTLFDTIGTEYTSFTGRGTVIGKISRVSEAGPRVNLTADSIFIRLNRTVDADAYFGTHATGTRLSYATQFITNPSLETATTGYAAIAGTSGTAAVTRSNTTYPAVAGTYHGRVTWSVSSTAPGGGVSYTQVFTSGTTYFARWSVYTNRTAQTVRLVIEFLNASNAVIETHYGDPTSIYSTGYTELSRSGTSPSGTTQVRVSCVSVNEGTGGTYGHWANGNILIFDALMLSDTDTAYFDGASADSAWSGTAHASRSVKTVSEPIDEGYDATLSNAFRYYCGLAGISTGSITTDPQMSQVAVALPSWTGNLWSNIKQLGIAYGVECVVRGDQLVFRYPHQRTMPVENTQSFQRVIDTGGNAERIELVDHNYHFGANEVAYQLTSSISVDAGETTVHDAKIPHSLGSVNTPTMVPSFSPVVPSNGYYMVRDSNDIIVSPLWWVARGGWLKTEYFEDEQRNGTVRVTVHGPTGEDYQAPYSLTWPDDSPALYVTGTGVFTDPVIRTFVTGAPSGDRESAATINNLFMSSIERTSKAGALAAQRAGGPVITISGFIPFDASSDGQEFGNIVGSRIEFDHAFYRVTDAAINVGGIRFNAEQATLFSDALAVYSETFDESNVTWAGFTFSAHDTAITTALGAGATFDDVNELSPSPTFDTINSFYEGMSFNDHSVFPLLTEVMVTDAAY